MKAKQSRGWSPKFATGLNVRIGIDQKKYMSEQTVLLPNRFTLIGGSSWQKDSLVTLILFELYLL